MDTYLNVMYNVENMDTMFGGSAYKMTFVYHDMDA